MKLQLSKSGHRKLYLIPETPEEDEHLNQFAAELESEKVHVQRWGANYPKEGLRPLSFYIWGPDR